MPESKMWSVALGLGLVLLGRSAGAIPPTPSVFNLKPNPKFVKCLQLGSATPFAQVTVTQNTLNDDLAILVRNVKPNLAFDLFTIQHANLLPNPTVDPNFLTFGLAWYQSDIEIDSFGNALTVIRSVFVNQIFGFDPAASLSPANTFHVGFWFNNPNDSKACGFDPTKPTPFNGAHNAGPNAMISVPNATTGLRPRALTPTLRPTLPRGIPGQNGQSRCGDIARRARRALILSEGPVGERQSAAS